MDIVVPWDGFLRVHDDVGLSDDDDCSDLCGWESASFVRGHVSASAALSGVIPVDDRHRVAATVEEIFMLPVFRLCQQRLYPVNMNRANLMNYRHSKELNRRLAKHWIMIVSNGQAL